MKIGVVSPLGIRFLKKSIYLMKIVTKKRDSDSELCPDLSGRGSLTYVEVESLRWGRRLQSCLFLIRFMGPKVTGTEFFVKIVKNPNLLLYKRVYYNGVGREVNERYPSSGHHGFIDLFFLMDKRNKSLFIVRTYLEECLYLFLFCGHT